MRGRVPRWPAYRGGAISGDDSLRGRGSSRGDPALGSAGSPDLPGDPGESRWTLSEVARMAGGRLNEPEAGDLRFLYHSISLDSRTLVEGEFFVALRGERHDAHAHLPEVAPRALGALVDRPLPRPGFPQIVVEDSLAGWQRWSAAHRARLSGIPLLGLTGSSGKTTSKDIVAHLLSAVGRVRATEGNRNNHVGVPWTLLGLDSRDRFAVVEMGMNHAGEIALMTRLAAPAAALITDIGTAHVGYLGSREAILRAKLEILEGMAPDAPLTIRHDPWVLERLPADIRKRPFRTFGLAPEADLHPEGMVEWSLSGSRFTVAGIGQINLSLLGPGAVLSALAALSSVEALGCDPKALAPRLATVPRRPLRMEPRIIGGVQWLLDCYNASPESSLLSIHFLREVRHEGRRILVLGALGELGEHSEQIHQDLGRRSGAIETVLFVGEEARHAWQANRDAALSSATAAWVADAAEAADWLRPRVRPGDLVLLKGSRRVALERILDGFVPASGPRPEKG